MSPPDPLLRSLPGLKDGKDAGKAPGGGGGGSRRYGLAPPHTARHRDGCLLPLTWKRFWFSLFCSSRVQTWFCSNREFPSNAFWGRKHSKRDQKRQKKHSKRGKKPKLEVVREAWGEQKEQQGALILNLLLSLYSLSGNENFRRHGGA